MEESKIERAVEVLEDDYYRQGSKLSADDVRRVLEKRELPPDAAHEVKQRLASLGIEIPDDLPAQEVGYIPSRPVRLPMRATVSADSLRAYLKEIGRYRLLTQQDEVRLGRRIRAGLDALELLASGRTLDAALDADIRAGAEAQQQMIEANLRLVVSIAKHYARATQLDVLDLIQEGALGLMRAVEKFDHTLGYKFSTYATWWIRQSITRAIADKGRAIRLPVHVHESLSKVRRTRAKLTAEFGREPTLRELADQLDLEAGQVQFLLDLPLEPVSLNLPVGGANDSDDGGSVLGDFVDVPYGVDPGEALDDEMLATEISQVLLELTDRERAVLIKRFGLNGEETHTLEEIGQEFGVTRERIRQIENKALKHLRTRNVLNRLEDFVDFETLPKGSS